VVVVILLILLLAFFYYSNIQKKAANKQLMKQKEEIEQKNRALEKAYQEISEQKEQLEKINQVKNKLFSIISHEFRSPLNSLKGALSLVQHGVITQEELADLSKDITDKINNTSIFLDNLLNWARSQMQGIEVKKQQVHLNQLIKSNIDLLKPQADKKSVEIVNKIPEDFTVFADRDMVNLIIRNLISNAIKFSLENGKIEISATKEKGMTEIRIKDNGVGIPEENLKRLFDLDTITTTGTANEKGTGLGLMISKNFVEAQGGNIFVKSKERKGSVFSFTIPD
jgi:signal transduction histidine kinase